MEVDLSNAEKLIKYGKIEQESTEDIVDALKSECAENVQSSEKLLEDINLLISKQQGYVKIAQTIGSGYSALNNGFEMKKQAEILNELVNQIQVNVERLCQREDKEEIRENLTEISGANRQIGTLINYLNNPKSIINEPKVKRFDELLMIEENELKRRILETIKIIIGKAELKKLKDDLEQIEQKANLNKFVGIFTGKNRFDKFLIEQIDEREKAINKTLVRKLSLSQNYSIHEMSALINMFIEDNKDDELVFPDIQNLKDLESNLKKNFVISEAKIVDIISEKEAKNLPIEYSNVNRRELVEIETYRFLNKYGYDIEREQEEQEYQDTTANEIKRIVDYINSSNIV